MATLTNPVRSQNIVDRFADYVTATANAGIVWGTNALPFPEMPSTNFGGTTSGRGITVNGSSITPTGSRITASNIYDTLVNETATYTNIRNLRALLFVEGNGGNTGIRPNAGFVFDQTAVSHLNVNYRQNIGSPANSGVASNQTISVSNLENFFNNLRTAYNNARATTATIQVNVCHASCHNSCHSSRGRR
jgi:hypothetical protein